MFFYSYSPCPSAGPADSIRSVLILSSLLPLSLQTANAISTIDPTDTEAAHNSRAGLPPIVIICIVASGVFFIALGSISLYLYVRRSRERTKRNEHREKAWQFKDMRREGLRPTLKTEGVPTGNKPIQISDPVLMTEVTSSPRYPTRAFHW